MDKIRETGHQSVFVTPQICMFSAISGAVHHIMCHVTLTAFLGNMCNKDTKWLLSVTGIKLDHWSKLIIDQTRHAGKKISNLCAVIVLIRSVFLYVLWLCFHVLIPRGCESFLLHFAIVIYLKYTHILLRDLFYAVQLKETLMVPLWHSHVCILVHITCT